MALSQQITERFTFNPKQIKESEGAQLPYCVDRSKNKHKISQKSNIFAKKFKSNPIIILKKKKLHDESIVSEFTFNEGKSFESCNDDSEPCASTNITTYDTEKMKSISNLSHSQPKTLCLQITLFRLKQLCAKIESSIKKISPLCNSTIGIRNTLNSLHTYGLSLIEIIECLGQRNEKGNPTQALFSAYSISGIVEALKSIMKDRKVNRECYSHAQEMTSICNKLDSSSVQTNKIKISIEEPKDKSIPRVIGKAQKSKCTKFNQKVIDFRSKLKCQRFDSPARTEAYSARIGTSDKSIKTLGMEDLKLVCSRFNMRIYPFQKTAQEEIKQAHYEKMILTITFIQEKLTNKNKQRFFDTFCEVKKNNLAKIRKIIENSESQRPNKELLSFVEQMQNIHCEDVFDQFEENNIKEKNWIPNLNDVFVSPYGWRNKDKFIH